MNILGIGGSNHDYSFCIVQDGTVKVAIEEERLSRERNSCGAKSQFFQGLNYCLDTLCLHENDLNLLIATDIFVRKSIPSSQVWQHLLKMNHHMSHAASSYYTSEFNESALLVVDGGGSRYGINQCELVSMGIAGSNYMELFDKQYGAINPEEIQMATDGLCLFSDGVASFYSFMTVSCGFHGNQEGKLMGLAPYGTDIYVNSLRKFIDLNSNYEFHMSVNGDLKQFICDVYKSRQDDLFYAKADLAYAAQAILEEYFACILHVLYKKTMCKNLCFSGGVALNSVLNGKIKQISPFENIHIFPAANDAGTAVGAALYGYYQIAGNPWRPQKIKSVFFGRTYSDTKIYRSINKYADKIHVKKLQTEELYKKGAEILAQGKTLGWFRYGAEFGPRALGNRSIFADSRISSMKQTLNSKVKFREDFRPFAPMVLAEKAEEYFILENKDNSFMLFVGKVCPSKYGQIPAVTHVDGSARVQTISGENPSIYKLLHAFYSITGIPILINTSFNIKGEPIVESPEDAIRCLVNSGLDYVMLHNWLLWKRESNCMGQRFNDHELDLD